MVEEPAGAASTDSADLRFYWMTGCSSCQRTKEYLQDERVEFTSINLSETPDRMADLGALGLRTVPVLVRGQDYVIAQDLKDVATFVGRPFAHASLPPCALVEKLSDVLASAVLDAEIVPDDKLSDSLAGRDRPHRELIHHIFRIPDAFLEAVGGIPLTNEAFMVMPADGCTADELAAYGRDVRNRVGRWWASEADKEGQQMMTTYFGVKPMAVVLERTTWHAAHHTRQLEQLVLDGMKLASPKPLSAQTLEGLPLPGTIF